MIYKKIFGRIWAAWGIILFLATMLLFYLPLVSCYLLKEPLRSRRSYVIYRLWMRIFLPLTGIRVAVTGKEHFRKGQAYVLICNHRSMMDIPVSSTKIPGPNKTIAKAEMSKIPLFGDLYRLGSVLVDRKSKASRAASLLAMKQVIREGLHMVIYPEGTRNKTADLLRPFHDGAFTLAAETGTPIIIGIIKGTADIMPSEIPFCLLPGNIRFEFLQPVSPSPDAAALKNQCYRIMESKLADQRH